MLQPPTDNLYKFIAIFGLLLFGFSFYIPLQRLENYEREVTKWNAAWAPLIERQKLVDDDIRSRLDCSIDSAQRAIDGKRPSTLCAKLAESDDEAKRARQAVSISIAEHSEGKAMLEHLRRQYIIFTELAVATGLVGLALVVLGFWLWYVRVQKPLDALNRQAAKSAVPPPS